jgi:hypothetical protein
MLKTRREELSIAKVMNYCFSDSIIPLFEILTDRFEVKYKIDPVTNTFVYELKGKRRMRIKETPTDSDIITLDFINKLVDNKIAFIDYFRFTIDKYGENIDLKRTDLAWKLSRDNNLYRNRVKEISNYRNLIPVVSIKQGFTFGKNDLEEFLYELQKENDAIGLRITEEWLEEYSEVIKDTLRNTDYLLFDIGEQPPTSKFMELEEVMDLGTNGKVILVNSPRKADIRNGAYEDNCITKLIDNSAREVFSEYEFEGIADYCGLKDTLPANDGSNGTGAALALLYDYDENGFYSFLNPDTSQGMAGYYKIIPEILSEKDILDPLNNCPAIQKIEGLKGSGSWSTWHNINVTRYIHQMYSNI